MLLGYAGGEKLNCASLTLTYTGAVQITEDSSMSLTGTSSVNSLTLVAATGGLSIDGTVTVGTLADLSAIGSNPDVTLNNRLATTSGTILLKANRNVRFAPSQVMHHTTGPAAS